MKKVLIFIFILLTVNSFAQRSCQITYSLAIEANEKNPLQAKYSLLAQQGAEKVSFILDCNQSQSRFYLDEDITNNDNDTSIAIGWADYANEIFTNLYTKEIMYNNPKGVLFKENEFLIKEPIYLDWELSEETKEIQGFICFKAIANIVKENISKSIIAWYCPEIPFAFGPLGYGTLPGVILELQVNDVLFGATKIDLNKTIKPIELPNKGKELTEIEYHNLFRQ